MNKKKSSLSKKQNKNGFAQNPNNLKPWKNNSIILKGTKQYSRVKH